ncbi:MAG: recombinase family protein [Proteobacteria bacterium]|nr:recombinase family protein [Pseudomonadota bacterium]
MQTIGYIRVSTEQQDADKQKHLLLGYAHDHKMVIQEFIMVEVSSRESPQKRKIDLLCQTLQPGDQLIVAELSRLGRNMLETLNLIEQLTQYGVKLIFIRQPELSTTGQHAKLLLAIYSYFAESEREFISTRTKQGLAAVQAKGIKLGRPLGSKNNNGNVLSPYRSHIQQYLQFRLSLSAIQKLINPLLKKPISYNSFKYFIEHDSGLRQLRTPGK